MIDHTAVTHDSLAPDRLTPFEHETSEPDLSNDLQLSINRAVLRRLDDLALRVNRLEADNKRLRKDVAYLMGAHTV